MFLFRQLMKNKKQWMQAIVDTSNCFSLFLLSFVSIFWVISSSVTLKDPEKNWSTKFLKIYNKKTLLPNHRLLSIRTDKVQKNKTGQLTKGRRLFIRKNRIFHLELSRISLLPSDHQKVSLTFNSICRQWGWRVKG